MSLLRIPKRLKDKVPGARGSNNTFCFRFGTGPFQAGEFAAGLDLVPDSPTHGCVTPAQLVPLAQYEADLAATRTGLATRRELTMARQPLTMSPNYLAVVRGIRELHRLALEGRDESPEADAVRDATDGPWEGLSEAERKRVSGLSEDLYSISDRTADEPRQMNPQAQARLNDVGGSSSTGRMGQGAGAPAEVGEASLPCAGELPPRSDLAGSRRCRDRSPVLRACRGPRTRERQATWHSSSTPSTL